MNFEELRKEMDNSLRDETLEFSNFATVKGLNNPVQKIRANMLKEIIIQLVAIVIFMIYPIYIAMPEFSEAVYYVFMFMTSIMTMAYIIKLSFFLRRTSNFELNTKEALQHFVFETKLTLEVYKSFIIAGSLLLPVPVFALLAGYNLSGDILLFEKWFLLQISVSELVILIFSYLAISVLFYYITVYWAKLIYGKYVRMLEEILQEFKG